MVRIIFRIFRRLNFGMAHVRQKFQRNGDRRIFRRRRRWIFFLRAMPPRGGRQMLPPAEFFTGFVATPTGQMREERKHQREHQPFRIGTAEAQGIVLVASAGHEGVSCRTLAGWATARFPPRGRRRRFPVLQFGGGLVSSRHVENAADHRGCPLRPDSSHP